MKYRMYSLVLRQLNPIQKGVQTTHAVVEYASAYSKTQEYQRWANFDKTLIILDGGTYQDMSDIIWTLSRNKCKYAYFEEEDLNGLVTSIVFIADERVWDKKTYPDFDQEAQIPSTHIDENGYVVTENPLSVWTRNIGGETNALLREIISHKKLAN